MFFWFKPKQVTLNCFTSDQYNFEYTRIKRAVKFFPEWFKKLPLQLHDPDGPLDTLKNCHGFTELYKHSYIIPFNNTLRIDASDFKKGEYVWNAVSTFNMDTHKRLQIDGYLPEDNVALLKFNSSWIIKSSKSLPFLFHEPIWNRKRFTPFYILPGVVDYRYTFNTDCVAVLPLVNEPYTVAMEPGDPMVMITPLEKADIKIEYHKVSDKDFECMFATNLRLSSKMFGDRGRDLYQKKKEFVDQHSEPEPKCPFGFKK